MPWTRKDNVKTKNSRQALGFRKFFLLAAFAIILLGSVYATTLILFGSSDFSFSRNIASVDDYYAVQKKTEPTVVINNTDIVVEVATSSAAVYKGLSGTESLGVDNGMLFVFSKADRYKFWMPDMNFPIDIIWINNGTVADIDHNVTNKFDWKKPIFYSPATPVKYVLEVNAGFAKKKNIKIGDTVIFKNIE